MFIENRKKSYFSGSTKNMFKNDLIKVGDNSKQPKFYYIHTYIQIDIVILQTNPLPVLIFLERPKLLFCSFLINSYEHHDL